jgi:hypothetical protein
MAEVKLIRTREELLVKLNYIAQRAGELGREVLGHSMVIDTLTVFTHSEAERAALDPVIRAYGPESLFTHGKTLYVEPEDLMVAGHLIKYLGVRDPEADRTEVGYADYPVDDFAELLKLSADNPFMTPVTSGRGQDLIEVRHPAFDVRAYAVAAGEH